VEKCGNVDLSRKLFDFYHCLKDVDGALKNHKFISFFVTKFPTLPLPRWMYSLVLDSESFTIPMGPRVMNRHLFPAN
jgi:hypothetical protein